MREQRWKRLRTGLLIIAFSAIGMLEYVQLVQAFDLPQMMLVVPVVSVIAMLLLGKYSFFVKRDFNNGTAELYGGDKDVIGSLNGKEFPRKKLALVS